MGNYFSQSRKGMNYNLYTGTLNELSLESKTVINTINQYSYCVANEDKEFRNALVESDILLPDGEGVVLAERILSGRKINKISGADLHQHILTSLNHKNGRCFYLGAINETLEKIKARIQHEYPNVVVGYYSPPFKSVFNEEDNNKMIAAINDFGADALFIGLTAPKQEKWSWQFKSQIDAKVICAIGAVFDFYSQTVKRPSDFFIRYKLEWLGRLLSNPRKMWRRYLYYGPIYVYHIFKLKFAA
ncbi:glycosyltransferase [Pedobacter sp. G11]|uniref:WecB/TagA/CpsF family glycosyltransferase n=1 Tax=Pedobacter sp. G11 TaxID=2482728 RepID=UPI000F5E7548|nr:WecB/TagA/CpsF family glycosyltransferase [Pedobacter sp. G11]AZI25189.1 glycosyltransferase [Pedobacter sp. G11]